MIWQLNYIIFISRRHGEQSLKPQNSALWDWLGGVLGAVEEEFKALLLTETISENQKILGN